MQDRDSVDGVVTAGLRLLARREHSRLELRRKLQQRGFVRAAIEVGLERLTLAGALDDQRFMAMLIRHRRAQGYGRQRVRSELRDHGLATGWVEVVMAEENGGWVSAAAEQAQRYRARGHSKVIERRHVVAHLAQRGFSRDEALEAAERVFAGPASPDAAAG